MQCVKCGTIVPEASRFCLSCGSSVTDPGAATAVLSAPPTDPLLERLRESLAEDYAVDRELGRGGMAIVFKATEVSLRRPVALKVLPPEMAITPSIAERFRREARMAASLDHPNIIPVYRVGQAAGLQYMAMKFVEGCALDDIVKRQGALPLEPALLVLRAATSALAYAHEHGIVHRDIKGANILVERDGRVLLSDFGIARAAEEAALTASGSVMGTPFFMSPEQCSGQPVGPQSDQYSLGIVAFHLLAGQVPFDAETLPGILHHHFFTPPPDLGRIRADLPPALTAWISRALSKKPDDRFATTRDMLKAIEHIPLDDDGRTRGDEMLRALASGTGVDRVETRPFTAPSVVAPGSMGTRGSKPIAAQLASTDFVDRGRLTPKATLAVPQATPPAPEPRPAAPATPAPPRRPSRLPLVAVVVAILAFGGAFAAYALLGGGAHRTYARGAELFKQGRLEAARGTLEKAAREDTSFADPHILLARLSRQQGDVANANREAATAVRLAPNDTRALVELAAAQFASGHYDVAARFFTRVVNVDRNDRSAQGYLGCSLARLGRMTEATRWIQRAGDGPWRACAPH